MQCESMRNYVGKNTPPPPQRKWVEQRGHVRIVLPQAPTQRQSRETAHCSPSLYEWQHTNLFLSLWMDPERGKFHWLVWFVVQITSLELDVGLAPYWLYIYEVGFRGFTFVRVEKQENAVVQPDVRWYRWHMAQPTRLSTRSFLWRELKGG